MPDPEDPSPTAPRGLGGLDANMRAFLALLAPPLSSLAAWRHWGSDRLVRHYAVQGTVFGVAVLVSIAGFKLCRPRSASSPDGGLGVGHPAICVSVLAVQSLLGLHLGRPDDRGAGAAALVRPNVIAPLTRRLLGGGDDRV